MGVGPSIIAEGLTFAYPSGHVVLQDVNLAAFPGTITCVTGDSGAGKSTLLYCLAGVLSFDGRVVIMGQPLTSSPTQRAEIRLSQCGFVFQRGELLPELTVLENVSLPLRLLGRKPEDARRQAEESLQDLGIVDCVDRRPQEISGGQAQRASVARALIHAPHVIFADEPTASLDSVSRDRVLSALRRSVSEGATVICATHDPAVMELADSTLHLREGAGAYLGA